MTGILKLPPAVSVVMPVYNCEQYVSLAIESILKQSFTDFEFIIIDDGSTDRSPEIIRQFHDQRINFIGNAMNHGNYPVRNQGMELAKGKYICVMDADDISEPERLKIQFQFMEKNPEVGICGTFIRNIPSNIIPRFIIDCEQLRVAFLYNNYCSHPSLMMRKDCLNRYNLRYNEEYKYSADFDLCSRTLRYFEIQNIPYVLLQYRRHSGQISYAKYAEQERYADMIRISQLIDILGFELEEIPVLLHLKLMKKKPLSDYQKVMVLQWINRLLERNQQIRYFNQKILEQFLLSGIHHSNTLINEHETQTIQG